MQDPYSQVLTLVLLVLTRWILHDYMFRTFTDNNQVPIHWIKTRKIIYGRVVRAVDGDGIRITHLPMLERWCQPAQAGDPKETLYIRLAGIDAPESACFGQPDQPFAQIAKSWLGSYLNGRIVRVQLLRRDQYNRLIGMVWVNPAWWPVLPTRNVSIEMLRRGLAVMYRATGAQYGGNPTQFNRVEQTAKAMRRGLWKSGDQFETPLEFKKRTRAMHG